MWTNIRFQVLIAFMKSYSNAYDYAIYTLNYYEDKYFISLFAHFKHKTKIYNHYTYTLIIIKKSYNFSTFCFLSAWTFLHAFTNITHMFF